MWLDNLKELKTETGLSAKQIAEKENMPERTVTRIFSGDTESPRMDQIIKIVHALGGSLDDIFEDTQAVVGRSSLAALQEENERLTEDNKRLTNDIEKLNGELALAVAESAMLNGKVVSLTAENDILRLKLDHKEEIIALHNYYIKLKASE